MATQAVSLPIVAGGLGAGASTAFMSKEKTVTITGLSGNITIEASNDGVTWCPKVSMSAGSGESQKTVSLVCKEMRVNATGGGASTVFVAAERSQVRFASLAAPANGPGASVDVTQLGQFNTAIADVSGGQVTLEISQDDVNFAEAEGFSSFTQTGCDSGMLPAKFARAVGKNYSGSGIELAACDDAGAAIVEPRTCLIYDQGGTDEGNRYTDFHALMEAKAAISGPVRICVEGPDFTFNSIPAPPAGTVYDFVNTEFYVDAQVIFVLFSGAQDWNALPEFNARTVGLYVFGCSQAAYDTSRGTNSAKNQANLLVCNIGRIFLDQFGGTPIIKVTAGRQVVIGSRSGGVALDLFFGAELIELEDDGELVYLPQSGSCRIAPDMIKSTAVGDGRIAALPNVGASRDQWELENQSNYSGAVIDTQPLGQPGVAELYNERHAANPPRAMDGVGAPTVHTAAVTADHGDLLLCDSDGGDFTVTLKSALGHFGEKVTVVNLGTNPANKVTIAPAAGETIVNGPITLAGAAAVAGVSPAGATQELKIIRSEDNVVAANRVWVAL
jgi:hypothetical protein